MDIQINRREAIASLLAISATGALAACSDGTATNTPTEKGVEPALKYASDGAFFSSSEMAFLSSLASTIIPKTETAGAIEAGVPAVLQGLASEWADDGYRRYWRDGIRNLDETFKKQSGQSFTEISAAQQNNLLSRYDAQIFDNTEENQFYRDMKSTIATAYYMSEPGASEELAYEAVPGDWKGCVPLADYPKAWAT